MKQRNKTMENHPMNQDVFAGQWKQMRGELKSWWGNSLMTTSTGSGVRRTN